jgi:hypothetical protein
MIPHCNEQLNQIAPEESQLFKDEKDGKGILSPGDPIRLLWDIEQAYPNIN